MNTNDPNLPSPDSNPPVSAFTGPIAELIAHGLLSAPTRPGLLATLDHFDILRVLGGGGMGIVLLARNRRSGGEVAIKMVRPELAADSQMARRFVKEARHLEKLKHTNVMPVLEVAEREAGPYFVMPYFEKGSMARRIRAGEPLPPDVVLEIAMQVCAGLQFAHRRGIIHRDLKPANILLAADGKACLADFGLARTVFNDSIVDVENAQCEGTPVYMSPGVAAGNAEDTRCDIYAFGALMYEMLTGEPPYKGRTTREIQAQILKAGPIPIAQVNPKAEPGLVSVAQGAMARELRDRYADMTDVLADLQRVKDGKKPLGPRGAGQIKKSDSSWMQRHARPVLVSGLLIILTVGVILWLHSPSPLPAKPAVRPVNDAVVNQPAIITNLSFTNTPIKPVAESEPIFKSLWGVALDNAENIYVTDSDAGAIYEINPAGQATIKAGRPGFHGSVNGKAANARFIIPRGTAMDAAGNLYVSDAYTVRKISSLGIVSILAGKVGYPGNTDGQGISTRLSLPSGIATDNAGNIFVADRYSIRKISSAGVVIHLAGREDYDGNSDGSGSSARFSDMEKGIAVDAAGNVYVADTHNHEIRKISPTGVAQTLAGSNQSGSADGLGVKAQFSAPFGIAVDAAGTVYVSDALNHNIRKITPDRQVTTLAGSAGRSGKMDGIANKALFDQPRGIALDRAGNIYVADGGNRLIRKITPEGSVSTLVISAAK